MMPYIKSSQIVKNSTKGPIMQPDVFNKLVKFWPILRHFNAILRIKILPKYSFFFSSRHFHAA